MARDISAIVQRAARTTHGFGDLRRAADEIVTGHSRAESMRLAQQLYASDTYQARMIATFVFGSCASQSREALRFMRERVSKDADWRVQEILAQAFDRYCAQVGYQNALATIERWLCADQPNVRRAVSEGLRIWTSRPYFKEHPQHAIDLLSPLRDDPSEYVRRSAGNALRDISRRHRELIRAELQSWDLSDKATAQTYQLASQFVS